MADEYNDEEPVQEQSPDPAPAPQPARNRPSRLPVLRKVPGSINITSPLASPLASPSYAPDARSIPTMPKRGSSMRLPGSLPGGRSVSAAHNSKPPSPGSPIPPHALTPSVDSFHTPTSASNAKVTTRKTSAHTLYAAASDAPLTPTLASPLKLRASAGSLTPKSSEPSLLRKPSASTLTPKRRTSDINGEFAPALNRRVSNTSLKGTPRTPQLANRKSIGALAPTEGSPTPLRRSPSNEAPSTPKTPRVAQMPRVAAPVGGKMPVRSMRMAGAPPDSPKGSPAKSSSALREQIAAARAAVKEKEKKAAQVEGGGFDKFDFGASADPFGQGVVEVDVLGQRLKQARFEGRLNISNLELKEVPEAVYRMYEMVAEEVRGVDEQQEEDGPRWYETVDLLKLVAADNEIKEIGEEMVGQFGALQNLDLHNNLLTMVPANFVELVQLTSLNLVSGLCVGDWGYANGWQTNNELGNEMLEIIFGISALKDLRLGRNNLSGDLDPSISNLTSLETLELQDNKLTALPTSFSALTKLRVLNVSKNNLPTLPLESLSSTLQDLDVSTNALSGPFFPETITSLPALQSLNISTNTITSLAEHALLLPSLTQLFASNNRIPTAPSVEGWDSLLVLTIDQNRLTALPDGIFTLRHLRSLDVSSNNIKAFDAQLGAMDSLEAINFAGNPLRDRNLASMNVADLKRTLRGRLAPPEISLTSPPEDVEGVLLGEEELEDQAGAAQYVLSRTGTLDLSGKALTTMPALSEAAYGATTLLLNNNKFTVIPAELANFTALTTLTLSHNPLATSSYLSSALTLRSLTHLTLHATHITTLAPLYTYLTAPRLSTLDVSANRHTEFTGLTATFPSLTSFLAADNQITEIDLESVRGLRVLDLTGNSLERLEPKLSLLGELRELRVQGNLFRVPRWHVLEKGSEAVLDWLRERVPVEEVRVQEEEEEEEEEL